MRRILSRRDEIGIPNSVFTLREGIQNSNRRACEVRSAIYLQL